MAGAAASCFAGRAVYQGADVLLTARLRAYRARNYHTDYLKGKALAIACPKLDSEQEIYYEKIKGWIDDAKINTLSIMIMQVPCCSGLLKLAEKAANDATKRSRSIHDSRHAGRDTS